MTIEFGPDLEAALVVLARQRGIAPEVIALDALRAQFLAVPLTIEPRDEWERRLLGIAINCGVSLPDSALSSDGLYE